MRLITILTAVFLISVGCAKGGGSSDSAMSAQSVSGTYKMAGTRANGDMIVVFATFSNGQYIEETYKFPAENYFKASFFKIVASDVVSGTTHNVTQTYATCSTLNGVVLPTAASFPVTPIGNNQIVIHSNMADADIIFAVSAGVNQTLSALGMTIATEVTDCTAPF